MRDSDKETVKQIEGKVRETIKRFKLLEKKERILVAASGGKDSTAVLYILNKLGYNVSAINVDAGIGKYTEKNAENLVRFCKKEGIKLYAVSVREEFGGSTCYIQSTLKSKGIKLNSCTVCGVLRRYLLNRAAKQLKAKKIVTGHNLDDEAQAIMMNFFRNTLQFSARLGPRAGVVRDKKFIPRVKPLYFLPEKIVEKYSKIMRFPVNYERCPCASDVFRNFVRNLLNEHEKTNPSVKKNIVDFFMEILPRLKKKYGGKKISYCIRCREPSKGEVCRTCQIIGGIRPKI